MADFKKLGTFEIDIDDKEVELAVIPQTADVSRNAALEYNKTFSAAVKGGALLRVQLEKILEKEEIWDSNKSEEYDKIIKLIQDNEKTLAKGGIKLTQARESAVSLRVLRVQLRDLISERTELEANTAEGQSENARFNFIIANTVVYNDTGERYFPELEDYLNSATQDNTIQIAGKTAEILYGLGDTYEKTLPENKFLLDYNLVNEELHLVDKDGSLCDVDFNRVDEEGWRIDEEGNRVSVDGQPLNNDGQYDYGKEFTEFEDDIWEKEEPKTKKRKPKPKPEVVEEAEGESSEDEAEDAEELNPEKASVDS